MKYIPIVLLVLLLTACAKPEARVVMLSHRVESVIVDGVFCIIAKDAGEGIAITCDWDNTQGKNVLQ